MRAILVVNPRATTTGPRSRDVLARALRSELDLEVVQTRRRGHAADLARRAAKDGVDVVVALGGDGTVNEVVNGLLTDGPGPTVPALGVVPGGSTNVFARSIGIPREPVEAIGLLLEALQAGRTRTIGLGRADDRWFTFCAGLGLDAEVIRRVERARHRGQISSVPLYLRATVGQYFAGTDRSMPLITLSRVGRAQIERLSAVIVQNTSPWTYIGARAVHPNPKASFDTGLDVMALRALHLPSTLRTAWQILSPRPDPRGRQVYRLHDVDAFTLTAERPLAVQVDGDYLGERDELRFAAVPAALRVAV
ncbi:MAG TPA: diacylglycerol kinase family protein [Cryptosporangiaceae bacterium]|nr:diacylglycerol kinase family protein [Cryptosporangiaceae bacterium]